MNSKQTLEQRVAALLDAKNATSAQLGELIAEIYAALDQYELEHKNALDPNKAPDANKAWQGLGASAFMATRLRAQLPRVQAKYQAALTAEEYAQWLPRYQEVKDKEAALQKELAEVYPEVVRKLVDLFERIEQHGFAARAVNASKPAAAQGDGRDCDGALGADIAAALRLPDPSNPRFFAFPVPSTPIAIAAANATPASNPRLHSAEWWLVQEEDKRIVAATKQRAAAERQREIDERPGIAWWRGETA